MARVEIAFFTAGNRSREGGTMPVPYLRSMTSEALTAGASSSASLSASTAAEGTGFVRILSDGDVWVVAGPAPVAVVPAAGETRPGLRVKAGFAADLAVAAGDRIAVRTME